MAESTRQRFLDVARRQFAERGYYGASIASIAMDLGLSKQALLHHFGSKEKLYGEVLEGIATRMMTRALTVAQAENDPVAQLEAVILGRIGADPEGVIDARLLMRELLDNEARAESAGRWYLKPWLEQVVRMVRRIPGEEDLDEADALATVYQLVGAANYLAMAGPTLTQMFGAERFERLSSRYPEVLRSLIRARFAR